MDGLTGFDGMDADEVYDYKKSCLKLVLVDIQTPLLRKEIQHAKALPETAREDFDVVFDRIIQHWTKVHDHLCLKVQLFRNIHSHHAFLANVLLAEYTGKPCLVEPFILTCARTVEKQRLKPDQWNYSVLITFPLEQMMLNQEHVENRLIAATSESKWSSHIQGLIDKKDWTALATTVENDRDVVKKLFAQEPYYKTFCKEELGKTILKGIDAVQAKYLAGEQSMFSWNIFGLAGSGVSEETKKN